MLCSKQLLLKKFYCPFHLVDKLVKQIAPEYHAFMYKKVLITSVNDWNFIRPFFIFFLSQK